MNSLSPHAKRGVIIGSLWAFVEVAGQQGLQFFVSIVVARLLEPREFGLIAMIAVFIYSPTLVIEGGLNASLTQNKCVRNIDMNTVFWFNLFLGTFFLFIIWLSAPLIADFFNQPALVKITRCSIWGFYINCFGIVHLTMLQRELRFRERALVGTIAIIFAGLVSTIMAFKGYGVWALVAQFLIAPSVRVLGLWLVYPWRPNLEFDYHTFKKMFVYARSLMITNTMGSIFDNAYSVIIGKWYTASDLGYYSRGKRFSFLASNLPATVIQRVSFPTLSVLQSEPNRLAHNYMDFLRATMLFVAPLLTLIAITAPNFICVLIGEKWLPVTPYLRLLCISSVFFPVHIVSRTALNAIGCSAVSLKIETFKYIMILFSIALLYRQGITALLIGEAVAMLFTTGFALYLVSKFLPISLLAQVKLLGRVFGSALTISCLSFVMPDSLSVEAMVLKTLVGIFIFIGGLVLFQYQMVAEILMTVKSKLATVEVRKK